MFSVEVYESRRQNSVSRFAVDTKSFASHFLSCEICKHWPGVQTSDILNRPFEVGPTTVHSANQNKDTGSTRVLLCLVCHVELAPGRLA